MAIDLPNCEVLDLLIDELDVKARSNHLAEQTESYWVCQRRFPRHPFRVACRVHYMSPGGFKVMEMPGRTRNLSRSGIGLLVRRVFSILEPVEIEVITPGRPTTYMAGLVRFCRYAGRGFHELGVQLKSAGADPVICRQPALVGDLPDWVQELQTNNY